MSCPKNNQKQYIIPTKNWLKPIKPYIVDDLSTEGLLMLTNYLEREKIIVKIKHADGNK